jgi:hypothetical protein
MTMTAALVYGVPIAALLASFGYVLWQFWKG